MRVVATGAKVTVCHDCYPGLVHVELDMTHPGIVNDKQVREVVDQLWAELNLKIRPEEMRKWEDARRAEKR